MDNQTHHPLPLRELGTAPDRPLLPARPSRPRNRRGLNRAGQETDSRQLPTTAAMGGTSSPTRDTMVQCAARCGPHPAASTRRAGVGFGLAPPVVASWSSLSMLLARQPMSPNSTSMEPALSTTSALRRTHRHAGTQRSHVRRLSAAPSVPSPATLRGALTGAAAGGHAEVGDGELTEGGASGGADGTPSEGVGQVHGEGRQREASQRHAARARQRTQRVVLQRERHRQQPAHTPPNPKNRHAPVKFCRLPGEELRPWPPPPTTKRRREGPRQAHRKRKVALSGWRVMARVTRATRPACAARALILSSTAGPSSARPSANATSEPPVLPAGQNKSAAQRSARHQRQRGRPRRPAEAEDEAAGDLHRRGGQAQHGPRHEERREARVHRRARPRRRRVLLLVQRQRRPQQNHHPLQRQSSPATTKTAASRRRRAQYQGAQPVAALDEWLLELGQQ
eukprot:scaffold446_cov336-Prasinococcus_capsulatus_cf.AAC.2